MLDSNSEEKTIKCSIVSSRIIFAFSLLTFILLSISCLHRGGQSLCLTGDNNTSWRNNKYFMGLWNVLPPSALWMEYTCVSMCRMSPSVEVSSQVWVRLSSMNRRCRRRWCTEVPLPWCLKEKLRRQVSSSRRVTRRKVLLIGLACYDTTIAAICPWCGQHARVALSTANRQSKSRDKSTEKSILRPQSISRDKHC